MTSVRSTAGPRGRTGATLTEVLMALLIMSVGIVSVITMFPLAVLRSIQATQLTNSRLMKQNIQQALRTEYHSPPTALTGAAYNYGLMNQSTFPRLPVAAGLRPYFRGAWEPNTPYLLGEIVVPARRPGSYAPTPNLWFVCQLAGNSGSIEPAWVVDRNVVPASNIVDGGAEWLANVPMMPATGAFQRPFQPILLNGVVYDGLNYVIDPLGWQMFFSGFSLDTTLTSANDFGYVTNAGLGGPVAPTNYTTPALTFVNHRLLRTNGGLTDLTSVTNALSLAEGIGIHGDTWITELSSIVESVAPVGALPGDRSAVFPATVDLSAYAAASQGEIRVVFTSNSGKITATRDLQPIDLNPAVDPVTHTVRWREPLPAGLVVDGLARIERVDKRYSWFATVNKSTQGGAKVSVAIVAKRSFTPDDEHVYTTDFVTPGVADQALVSWGATEPTPLIREGNYVLDAYTARWYKVLAISGATSPVTITFDQKIPINHRVPDGRLIFMRGIVEVFEL
jgi:hypothetical protein